MTFKMTLNDLEGQRSFSQNDLYNMNVKCTKFDVSTLISFEVITINQAICIVLPRKFGRTEKPSHRGAPLLKNPEIHTHTLKLNVFAKESDRKLELGLNRLFDNIDQYDKVIF